MSGMSLLYPFVCCASNGGPWDDQAFVAGVTFGRLAQQAKANLLPEPTYVPPALLPQLDLLAMRHGLRMVAVPWDEHPEEYALVGFTLGGVDL